MTTRAETSTARVPLSRERVLEAAVALADEHGIDAVSMRRVGQELGVEAMSLYNHVANKDDLLDGMVENVVREIDIVAGEPGEWRHRMRNQALTARAVMVRHPWAIRVLETRTTMTAPLLAYFDAILGILLDAGFSMELTHHAVHALGSRVLGFVQELFDDSDELADSPEVVELMIRQMSDEYPNLARLMREIQHDEDSILGQGCDDQIEFEFGLDVILDGLERLRAAQ